MLKNKWKSAIASFVAAMALIIAPSSAFAWSNNGNSNAGSHVTLCHRTGSNTNPYVVISPDVSGAYHGHYSEHQGPVYPAAGWGDIIPPFTYNGQTYSLNWNAQGQAIFNNGCQPTGGMGGGQKDCDGDYDNSPASECAQPQKDCDGDYDSSPASECTTPQPQKDCDGDYDNSPASDCTTPAQPQTDCDGDTDNSPATDCTTGGMGGGPTGGGTTTTTTTTGQVLGASTTLASGGLGAGQVSVLPQGSVNGGEGAAARTTSSTSVVGLVGSLLLLGSGLVMLNRRNS